MDVIGLVLICITGNTISAFKLATGLSEQQYPRICFAFNPLLPPVTVIWPVTHFRSDNGVRGVDKDAQSGRSRPPSAFHADGGGNSVSDWSSSDSVLQTRQRRGAMVAPLKH